MNMSIYNFGAGPAMLPQSILKEAQDEFLNWRSLGVSVLEVGHRTPEVMALMAHAEETLRALLSIPDQYQVLFLGGAARTHFAMIPMNLLAPEDEAGYLVTGIWSKMAYQEATSLKNAYCMASDEHHGYHSIPDPRNWEIKQNTAYVYYTPNETVNGVRFSDVPNTKGVPLVADMTSCLLTEPIDVTDYGLIFAGAQKNISNAGLTIVIIRNDLLERTPNPGIPSMLNYHLQAQHHSLYATPPVFNCYLADKMFDWLMQEGGVDVMYQRNCQKANQLYQYLDSSDFYMTSVHKSARSLVNICFSLKNPRLEPQFLDMAQQRGLYALKGHRLVGGLRASLYNAMPLSGVEALIDFMAEFEIKKR